VERSAETTGDDPDGEYLKRYRWFESGSLQQRVCEPSVPQLQRPTGRRLEERTDDQCSVDLHGELADAAVTDQLLGVRGRPGRLRGVGAAVGLAAGGTHAFGLRPRPSAFAIVERRSE